MARLFLLYCCSIFIIVASCNNNDTKTGHINPEQQMRNLISTYPDSQALRNKLVEYFAENGEYDKAAKENNLLIQKDSSNANLWDTEARLLFLNQDTMGAINAFQKAIQISPDSKYIIPLGILYAQKKDTLAISIADLLLKSPGINDKLQSQFINGLYYNYSGNKAKAISFFHNCLTMDYTFMDAYRENAIALYDMTKYQDALQLLQKAISVKSTFEEGYYWMARCYEKLGRKKEAVDNYRLALQMDSTYVEAKDALARLAGN